jgi:hypothetical protein
MFIIDCIVDFIKKLIPIKLVMLTDINDGKTKILQDVKSFYIPRKKWYRGKGNDSLLYNKDNNLYCCLGFYAKACGLTDDEIEGVAGPAELTFIEKVWNSFLLEDYREANALMNANDSIILGSDVREHKIKDIFKSHNIEVKFGN